MIAIRTLQHLDEAVLQRLITGYTSAAMYAVTKDEQPDAVRFELRLVALEQPLTKQYPSLDPAALRQYQAMAEQGYSFGAFDGEACVGIALAEAHTWNASLWVQELHVATEMQGQGIGRLLVEALTTDARAHNFRCIVCETQTTNIPAIQFYRALGFVMDGIDLSYYTNHDQESGEVAVFMKKRLEDGGK